MPKILPKPWYKKVVDKLAIKYNKDPRVIEYISHYPFSFLKQAMFDEDEARPIRLRHLGVFFLRRPDLKDMVYNKRMDRLKGCMHKLVEGGVFESEEEGLHQIEEMSKSDINRFYKRNVTFL